jgi:hypothetical protein
MFSFKLVCDLGLFSFIGNNTMSTNDSKVVVGLRRPTLKKVKEKLVSETPRLTGGIVCSSPFERLCELLAKWDFVPDACQAVTTKIKDMPVQFFDQIPTIFPSFANYIDTWEPLLFDEIKANVLSNFSSKIRGNIKSKPFQFSLAEEQSKQSYLQILETQFTTNSDR